MTVAKQLGALKSLADMILDQRLITLRAAQSACAETRSKLAGLDGQGAVDDCALVIAAAADLRYQTWADLRRKDLNMQLARQTVVALEASDAARLAFGKQNVLAKLQARKSLK